MSILIKNATVVTMNKDREVMSDSVVFIKGNRIEFVGSASSLRDIGHVDSVIDARGKVVMPGIINTHTHNFLTELRGFVEEGPSVHHAVYNMMGPVNAAATSEEAYVLGMLGTVDCLRCGCTSVLENSTDMQAMARASRDSGIRAFLGAGKIYDVQYDKVADSIWEFHDEIGENTLASALKLVEDWHGKENDRLRCVLYPHAVDTVSDSLFLKVRDLSRKMNLGVCTHACQSPQEVSTVKRMHGKTPIARLNDLGFLGPDCTLAHCIFVEPEDIKLLGASQTNISYLAACNARRGYVAPAGEFEDAGANVTIGTDNMLGDMTKAMHTALLGWRARTGKAQRPTSEHVLEMATLRAAKAVGCEKTLGSIEPGKIADVVILDFTRPHLRPLFPENVVSNFVHYGLRSDVETVIVDGSIVVEDRVVKTLDERELMKEAQKVSYGLLKRVGIIR